MKKEQQKTSNKKTYNCPLCARMIPAETRRLDICRNCISGSKFEERKIVNLTKYSF